VKPGADITSVTSAITEGTKRLTFKDILVFWGSTNDVSRNNSQEGLKKLIKFVEVNNNINIILLCVPHRHDLPGWSCVNNEIATFNRKLNKLKKSHKHVKVLKTGLDRNLFTRQGRH
jgi:chitinase